MVPRYQLETSITHDDNLSRGRVAGEKRSDQAYALQLSRDWVFLHNPKTRSTLTATAGGEAFTHHRKLNRAFGEGQATLEYRASGEFLAPTFGIFGRAAADEYRSKLRSGYRYAVGATASAALTDRISAFGSIAYDGRDARSAVFTGRSRSARVNLDYTVSDRGTLYLSGEYRRGDATASGFASLENIDIAKVFVSDDAFASGQLLSYRFEASTGAGVLGYNHGFSPKASLDVSWRHAVTTPKSDLSFVTTVPNRYIANQFVINILRRF